MAVNARTLVIGVSPFGRPDPKLVTGIVAGGATGVLDLGDDAERALPALNELSRAGRAFGVRVGDDCPVEVDDLPERVDMVLVAGTPDADAFVRWSAPGRELLAEVRTVDEGRAAVAAGFHGLVARGSEGGGEVGPESAFVLLQHLLRELDAPIWVAGGVGPRTAAAAVAGGAAGVVLDSQLALLEEATTPEEVKLALRRPDGVETEVVDGVRVLKIPALLRSSQNGAGSEDLLPAGQEASFARMLADRWGNAATAVAALRQQIVEQIRAARTVDALAPGMGVAGDHGTTYPIVQGPMTRVSDTPEFAAAIAAGGGLPFIALSEKGHDESLDLLTRTAELLGDRPWGAGILGFVPPELREEQLAALAEVTPPFGLIAGGRPSQARPLEARGMKVYLHVPSPGLLRQFLQDGARRFIFEGRECGGHVGPQSSFPLWEAQVDTLLSSGVAGETSVLFAGGIHDDLSAAMVATLAAPLVRTGGKVGVLMGTAYLFTHELVTSGAALPGFQQKALECSDTVLLETSPGHATRCADTAYVAAFEAERRRLEEAGASRDELWATLEGLNLGRLRVATKGLARRDDQLVEISEEEQSEEGMFMLGEVAAMHTETTTVSDLHEKVSAGSSVLVSALGDLADAMVPASSAPAPRPADVAIVGMACIFPGSPEASSFWTNVVSAKDAVTEVPTERWDPEVYYSTDRAEAGKKTPSKWGGFIPAVAFDGLAFGIPPKSLASIDPVQLLALHVASEALVDAGYAGPGARYFDRDRASVIFGAEAGTDLAGAYGFRSLAPQYVGGLPEELERQLPELTEDSFPGVLANVIAGRIANRLDLGGINYTVDAACASSLAAVDAAVKELQAGSSDVVLCGGADLHNGVSDYLLFASTHALSPNGRCASFDASADGIALGEGVACVVLKRLADAERDGDRVYAVIHGIAGASDGRSLGLTAPRPEGQRRALDRAYQQAGVSPAEVELIEAHGTGTVVGDRTELTVLEQVFSSAGAVPGSSVLGSVKSQIGHTKCAAGMAGMIKVARAIYHRVLPPTIHVETPNPGYDPDSSRFRFHSSAVPWVSADRRAAVSAFGFGGTNFHAVLGSAPSAAEPAQGLDCWPTELVALRGGTDAECLEVLDQVAGHVSALAGREGLRGTVLRDIAAAASRLGAGPVRVAIVASDIPQLAASLDEAKAALSSACDADRVRILAARGIFVRPDTPVEGDLAYLFSGQGSQRLRMFAQLFVAFPALHRYLRAGSQWVDKIFPADTFDEDRRRQPAEELTDTRNAQPALGIVELAGADLLDRLSVRPAMAAGHSYGELVALTVSGVIEPDALLDLSAQRAESILGAAGDDPGTMAAVAAGADQVRPLISDLAGVVVANDNAPDQVVISGPSAAIHEAVERIGAAGLTAKAIPVSCGFHSPAIAGAGERFAAHVSSLTIGKPAFPVWSNVSARPYPAESDLAASLLSDQVESPVRFTEQIEDMYAAGARVFLEVGPGRVLTGLVGRILGDRPHVAIPVDASGRGEIKDFLSALAQLMVHGVPVDTGPLFSGRAQRYDLSAPAPAAPGWLVNGFRVRNSDGSAVAGGLAPVTRPSAPLVVGGRPEMGGVSGDTRQAAVLEYLRMTRELVSTSRDVLLGFLGTPPPAEMVLAATAAPVIAAQVVEPRAEHTAFLDEAQMRQTVTEVIAERTGYPAEMLDPGLDLEGDLSIDSIKRLEIIGELTGRLHLADATEGSDRDKLVEELVRLKTIGALAEWLFAAAKVVEQPAQPVQAAPAAFLDEAQLRQEITEVIAERTGYPAEMLDPGLDLEGDLSIDSIKRLEIIGELAGRLHLADAADGPDRDQLVEELVRLKTIGAVAEWLFAFGQGGAGAGAQSGADTALAAESATAPPAEVTEPAVPERGLRFVPEIRSLPMPRQSRSLAGRRVAVTVDDRGVAPELARLLEDQGAVVSVLADGRPVEATDVFVYLAPTDEPPSGAYRFFDSARAAVRAGATSVLAVTSVDGNLGLGEADGSGAEDRMPRHIGIRGIVKTMRQELPEVVTRIVDLVPDLDAASAAALVAAELLIDGGRPEVGCSALDRCTVTFSEKPLQPTGATGDFGLGPDSVVLLTGGARGITARLSLALAQRYGCRLVLVGRAAAPANDETPETRAAVTAPELRSTLALAGFGTLPEIEREVRRILTAREIVATLNRLRDAGATAEYRSADARDEAELQALIAEVVQTYGRIDGVVHGAGVIEDARIMDKTEDSFARVFETKVTATAALMSHLPADTRFAILFGSVSGCFGNPGQVDYAGANDAMASLGRAWRRNGTTAVTTVHWGPWGGGGMVSAELEREFNRRGIGLLEPEDTVAQLMLELDLGLPDPEVVIMRAVPTSFATETAESEVDLRAMNGDGTRDEWTGEPAPTGELGRR